MLDFITWTADPAIFSIGSREIRWYGLAFAIGFLIGYKIVEKMWKREKLNPAWIDSPADLYDVGNSYRCPFGALSVLCSGLLSGESARNSEGLGGWTCQSWGTLGIIIAIYFILSGLAIGACFGHSTNWWSLPALWLL